MLLFDFLRFHFTRHQLETAEKPFEFPPRPCRDKQRGIWNIQIASQFRIVRAYARRLSIDVV